MSTFRGFELIAIIALTVLLSGCQSANGKKISTGNHCTSHSKGTVVFEPDSPVLKDIKVTTVKERKLEHLVEANAQLQPNANSVTRINPPIAGQVTSICANLGDSVRAGQLVATINSREVGVMIADLINEETEIDSALSRELLDLDYELKRLEAQVDLDSKRYERARLLMEEKIGSRATLETADTELKKNELIVQATCAKRVKLQNVADEKKRLARLALKQRLKVLGMTPEAVDKIIASKSIVNALPICTPQAGIVLERNVNDGELADPSKTLFVIDDIDNLWLVADIFEKDIKYISVGEDVDFVVDSFPDERFRARLDYVAGTINPDTRTLPVRCTVSNKGLKLKPKMFGRMRIHVAERLVPSIPRTAVQNIGARKVVYCAINKNTFKQKEVVLGQESGDFVEVVSGLNLNDPVVAEGTFKLRAQSAKLAHL
ncbi:MAG: efflux RND transporter periplasmic adaptor subunit [Cyanobacteria bacterium HKST-UBA02]|nr:efflux RND transporter periplasmic adaptor subunit [Cyanobacteria bacterium HKST-UBA02]